MALTVDWLESFWAQLKNCEGFNDVIPDKRWGCVASGKRAYAASTGLSGLRYRYVIRECDEGDRAGIELQIDTPSVQKNNSILRALEAQRTILEGSFGSAFVWNADIEKNPNRKRTCVRYYIGESPIPHDSSRIRTLQTELVQAMGRFVRAIHPQLVRL
jgi:hypothetical protein